MSKQANEQVQQFIERNRTVAEDNVIKKFPAKVQELDKFLASDMLSLSRIEEIRVDIGIPIPDPVSLTDVNGLDEQPPQSKKRRADDKSVSGTKVYSFTNGRVECNRHIVDLCNKIKPLIMDLMDSVNSIKMWIQMNIPRIEDGNNFGVSIQEEALAEARQVEGEAASYLDSITRYFISRAKLCSKLAKYPHLDDYRYSIKELDEKEFITLRLTCAELRNLYAGIHDMVMKNFDKIKKPRSQNEVNMY